MTLTYRPLPALGEPVPDGVFLNWPDDCYFADTTLRGSTDLMTLFFRKQGWWWKSPHNRARKAGSTKEQTYGSALHALFLEGHGAYRARFAVEPDKKAIPDLITSVEQCKKLWQDGPGMPQGRSAWKTEDWYEETAVRFPRANIWHCIHDDFTRTLNGRKPITADEDWTLGVMLDAAKADPDIFALMFDDSRHPPLAEVSVVWTLRDGIRRRARIDRLFPAFNLDLKSLGNWSGRDLKFFLGEYIAKMGYDIQRADYDDARHALYAFIAADQVYGGTAEQLRFLETFPEIAPAWDWVWLFYQKPDPSGIAPVLFPLRDIVEQNGAFFDPMPEGPLTWGRDKADYALQIYRACVAEFGLGDQPAADGTPARPWARVEPLHFTNADYAPHIADFPHWIKSREATAAAEAALTAGAAE